MARQPLRVAGEDYGPGDVRRPTVELAVDEVGEPTEEEPDGRGGGDRIGDVEEAQASVAGEEGHGQDHADQPAMEGHAAMPDGEDLHRRFEIALQIVEQDIADPA